MPKFDLFYPKNDHFFSHILANIDVFSLFAPFLAIFIKKVKPVGNGFSKTRLKPRTFFRQNRHFFYRFLSKNPGGLVKGFSKTCLKPRTFFRQNRHFFHRFLSKNPGGLVKGFLKTPTKPHRIFSSKIVIFRQKVPFFQNDPDTLFWGRGGYRTGPFSTFLPLFPKIPPKRSFFRAL